MNNQETAIFTLLFILSFYFIWNIWGVSFGCNYMLFATAHNLYLTIQWPFYLVFMSEKYSIWHIYTAAADNQVGRRNGYRSQGTVWLCHTVCYPPIFVRWHLCFIKYLSDDICVVFKYLSDDIYVFFKYLSDDIYVFFKYLSDDICVFFKYFSDDIYVFLKKAKHFQCTTVLCGLS